MKKISWVAGIFIAAILTGCGTIPEKAMARTGHDVFGGIAEPRFSFDLGDTDLVKDVLYAQYQEWKGTRYRLRGSSKNGIDCSGFVHITFKSKLGVNLPRSSDLMAELGVDVDKGELRAGDLVFFKTGKALKHVGVYLEDGRFLHASTKLGVVISHMDESYWKSAFWKARRLES